jgi:hypothetical protein
MGTERARTGKFVPPFVPKFLTTIGKKGHKTVSHKEA